MKDKIVNITKQYNTGVSFYRTILQYLQFFRHLHIHKLTVKDIKMPSYPSFTQRENFFSV